MIFRRIFLTRFNVRLILSRNEIRKCWNKKRKKKWNETIIKTNDHIVTWNYMLILLLKFSIRNLIFIRLINFLNAWNIWFNRCWTDRIVEIVVLNKAIISELENENRNEKTKMKTKRRKWKRKVENKNEKTKMKTKKRKWNEKTKIKTKKRK